MEKLRDSLKLQQYEIPDALVQKIGREKGQFKQANLIVRKLNRQFKATPRSPTTHPERNTWFASLPA